MEWMEVSPSDGALWAKVWMLYETSFPVYERRTPEDHLRAHGDRQFHCRIAVQRGADGTVDELLALLFYWQWERMIRRKKERSIYIEHLAVNPAMRGCGIGSQILRRFLDEHPATETILEIDPPVDDISRRRLRFYLQAGFYQTGFEYVNPAYRADAKPHRLILLSHPHPIDKERFERFKSYIFGRVMRYAEDRQGMNKNE